MGGESAFSHDPLHPPHPSFSKKKNSFSHSRSHQARVGLCCFPLPQHLFSRILLFFRPTPLLCPSVACAAALTHMRYFPFFSLVTFFLLLHLRTQTFPLQRHPSFSLEGLRGRKNVSASQMIFFQLFLSSSSSSCISPLFCQRQ